MAEYPLISADSHFVEPPNMWAERIDRRFRDRAPRAVRLDGKPSEYFVCEDLAPAPVAAFFSAGVPAVIGSLWEVNDESTAKLMAAFHHSWRSSTRSSGQALREAQLTFLHSAQERWRHPFYWAAFHVAGNGITV